MGEYVSLRHYQSNPNLLSVMSSLKLHNAMWPGLVGKGTDEGQEPPISLEHMLDLTGRRRVVFVDASESAEPPFEFTPIEARRDASHSSHVLSPAALLDAHRTVVGEPPEAWLLALRGERFELGEPLSPRARASLAAAVDSFVRVIRADEAPQSPS